MKLRTYKNRIASVLKYYTEEIARRLPYLDYHSMANRYRADSILMQIQSDQMRKEPQVPEWSLKIQMTYLDQGRGLLDAHVILDPEWAAENVLVLDFDK